MTRLAMVGRKKRLMEEGAKDTLSPAEKKANHIASEQKRRQAIRDGFDRLTDLVPSLTRAQGRSEAIVLRNCTSPACSF